MWSYFDISAYVLFTNSLFKMELMLYVECVIFALCSLTSLECEFSQLPRIMLSRKKYHISWARGLFLESYAVVKVQPACFEKVDLLTSFYLKKHMHFLLYVLQNLMNFGERCFQFMNLGFLCSQICLQTIILNH